jgi:urease accessory protein
MSSFAFALLADGRLPTGGHAHSAGVEAAVAEGRVTGEADLEAYTRGRLHTAGRTEASLAAAAVLRLDELGAVDAEAEARITTAPLRSASRRLGRQLVRAAAACWPSAVLAELTGAFPGGAHQPVALGAVGASAGLDALDVARLSLHHAVSTSLQAGVRLLGLDPFTVATLTARLGEEAEPLAHDAARAGAGPLRDLPATTGPVVEIAAVAHAGRDATLFAT